MPKGTSSGATGITSSNLNARVSNMLAEAVTTTRADRTRLSDDVFNFTQRLSRQTEEAALRGDQTSMGRERLLRVTNSLRESGLRASPGGVRGLDNRQAGRRMREAVRVAQRAESLLEQYT